MDQSYLKQFMDLQERIVFGISQVDLVEPRNWKPNLPIPSVEQEANIREIVRDRGDRLSDILGRQIEPIPFSNYNGYNLEWLFSSLLESCTTGRKWLYQGLKNFRLEDWIVDEELRARLSDPEDNRGRRSGGLFSGRIGGSGGKTDKSSATAAGMILKALRTIFPQDERVMEIIRDTIGRDDIDARPPSSEELKKLEARLRAERAKRFQSGS